MTAQSMNVLNSKLEKPVYILNFRPNFVVDGCEAFDEVLNLLDLPDTFF